MATVARFVPGAGQDKTYRTVTQDYQNPVYAAIINLNPIEQDTLVNFQPLTGALTVNVSVVNGVSFGGAPVGPFVGDKLRLIFGASGANRTVTFGTGLAVSASTLIVTAAKFGSIDLVFNGTAWQEVARTLTV